MRGAALENHQGKDYQGRFVRRWQDGWDAEPMQQIQLTTDELRMIQNARALAAAKEQPQQPQLGAAPNSSPITEEEWALIQLHRIARQSQLVGSGIMSNVADPVKQQHAIAIVVLKTLRQMVDEIACEEGRITPAEVKGLIAGQLDILGDDGEAKNRPEDPGPRR